MPATIVSINVSPVGGVPKSPVLFARVYETIVEGDKQKHTKFHGGPLRAVCLYSAERIAALNDEGHPIRPGDIGENVTVAGLDWDAVVPGVRLTLGEEVELEVTSYAVPCGQIAFAFLRADIDRVSAKSNPGWARVYTKVLRVGTVHVGDAVTLMPATAAALAGG